MVNEFIERLGKPTICSLGVDVKVCWHTTTPACVHQICGNTNESMGRLWHILCLYTVKTALLIAYL